MRKWLPLITICLGTFMLLIDVTIVNVALPDMAVDLHASFSSLQWVIDIYALALAAFLLGIGALADLRGRKPVYIFGLLLFAASSLAAGLSQGNAMLIVARGLQGVGGAAMFATTIALLNASYQGRDRGVAFGIWGAVNGAAAATGPILGGLLTQGLSWRWIFFVNLPVSVAAVLLSRRVLGAEQRRTDRRVDVPGMVAFTIAAGAVTFALTRSSENGWGSATTLGLFAAGLVALTIFIAIEARQSQPLIELALLRRGRFSGVLAGALLLSVAAFAYLTYTSLWLQSVRGMSPIDTGLAMMPLALCAFIVSASIGRFMHVIAPRVAIGGGLLLIGAGALLQAHLKAGSGWASLLAGLIVGGIGVGLATPVLASAALGAVPVQLGGMASGAVNTARQLGYALGIAALGVICQSRIESRLRASHAFPDPSSTAHLLMGGQARLLLAGVPASQRSGAGRAIRAAFASGLDLTMLVCGLAGLLAAAIVVLVVRGPGQREPAAASASEPPARRPAIEVSS